MKNAGTRPPPMNRRRAVCARCLPPKPTSPSTVTIERRNRKHAAATPSTRQRKHLTLERVVPPQLSGQRLRAFGDLRIQFLDELHQLVVAA